MARYFTICAVWAAGLIFVFASNGYTAGQSQNLASPSVVSPPEGRQVLTEERLDRIEAAVSFAEGRKSEESGNFTRALELYERALQADPTYLPSKIHKANALFQLHRYEEGLKLLEETAKDSSRSGEVNTLLAIGSFNTGKLSQARTAVLKAFEELAQGPTEQNASYYLPIVQILNGIAVDTNIFPLQKLFQKLLPLYEKAFTLDERNPTLHFKVAELCILASQPLKALQHYERTYEIYHDYPRIREEIISLLISLKEEKRAIELLEKMVREEPTRTPLFGLLGELYERQNNLLKAEDYYFLAVHLGNTNPQLYIRLAFVYLSEEQPFRAIALLEEAEKKFGKTPQIPFLKGIAQEVAKKPEAALDSFAQAERLGIAIPGFLDTNFYLRYGIAYEQVNDIHNAERMLKKALELNPKNHVAMNDLGYLWAERKMNLAEAEKLIIKALKLDPGNPTYEDSIGWVFYQKGEYQAALPHLALALKKLPEDPTINEHMGDIYEKLHHAKKAIEYWTRSLSKAAKPELLKEKIEKIQKK